MSTQLLYSIISRSCNISFYSNIYCVTIFLVEMKFSHSSFLFSKFITLCLPSLSNIHCVSFSTSVATALVRRDCDSEVSCSFSPGTGYFGDDPCIGIAKYTIVNYMCLWLVRNRFSTLNTIKYFLVVI